VSVQPAFLSAFRPAPRSLAWVPRTENRSRFFDAADRPTDRTAVSSIAENEALTPTMTENQLAKTDFCMTDGTPTVLGNI